MLSLKKVNQSVPFFKGYGKKTINISDQPLMLIIRDFCPIGYKHLSEECLICWLLYLLFP